MAVCDVHDDARHLGGNTWLMVTPEEYFPVLYIYFTYAGGQITLQAVHVEDD